MKRLHPWVAGLLLPGLATLPWPVSAQSGPADARNLQVAVASQPPARQEQRLALVIGNAAYKEAPLLNPVNDARAMAAALKQAGFTVLLHTDVDHRGLLNAVREFGNRLKQGGVGVFYFAGHGMQIKGRNYLVPVAADIQREDEVAYAALDAQAVLDKMEAAGNGTNLMILDACRNNPFARSFRSSTQGLAQMDAPVGTLVAFATAPGPSTTRMAAGTAVSGRTTSSVGTGCTPTQTAACRRASSSWTGWYVSPIPVGPRRVIAGRAAVQRTLPRLDGGSYWGLHDSALCVRLLNSLLRAAAAPYSAS